MSADQRHAQVPREAPPQPLGPLRAGRSTGSWLERSPSVGLTQTALVTEDFTVTKRGPSGKLCDAWWLGWEGSLPEAPPRPCWACGRAAFKGQGLPGSEGPPGTMAGCGCPHCVRFGSLKSVCSEHSGPLCQATLAPGVASGKQRSSGTRLTIHTPPGAEGAQASGWRAACSGRC